MRPDRHRLHAPPDLRQARDRDPQSRQARRDARTAGAARRRGGLGRRARPRRARGDRRHFRANAAIKAVAAAQAAQLPAFADDSGLVVDALDGAPGIYSARWAGPTKDFTAAMTRIERLLQERGATQRRDSARRISSLRCASPGPTVISRRSRRAPTARWSGRRAAPPASATIPMFLPDGHAAPSAR